MREKSEMTLREAAQQALDALELGCTDHDGNPVDLVGPAITALRAALAEEQNYVNRWISVEENLPKEGQPVLGLYYKSNIRIVYRREREDIDAEWADSGSGHSLIPPTHWMPLPEYEHVHKMESKATINELETVEPVAWMRVDRGHVDFHRHPDYLPLYTAPPGIVFRAVDAERERIAAWVEDMCAGLDAKTIANGIRNGGNDDIRAFEVRK